MALLFFKLARSITGDLNAFESTIREVERLSDLTHRVHTQRGDELGRIGSALDRMLEKIQRSMVEVATASRSLLDDTQNLRNVAESTSADTDHQRQTTTILSVSIQEFVQTLQNVAMNVGRTSDAADGTRNALHIHLRERQFQSTLAALSFFQCARVELPVAGLRYLQLQFTHARL
jgi:methyl-accepting chemotaxis protein